MVDCRTIVAPYLRWFCRVWLCTPTLTPTTDEQAKFQVYCKEYAKEIDELYYATSTAPKPDVLAVDVMMKARKTGQNDTAQEKLRVLRLERDDHAERERIRLERHWMEQD